MEDVHGKDGRERGQRPERGLHTQVHLGVLLKIWKRRGNGDQRTQQKQGDRISTPDIKIK